MHKVKSNGTIKHLAEMNDLPPIATINSNIRIIGQQDNQYIDFSDSTNGKIYRWTVGPQGFALLEKSGDTWTTKHRINWDA